MRVLFGRKCRLASASGSGRASSKISAVDWMCRDRERRVIKKSGRWWVRGVGHDGQQHGDQQKIERYAIAVVALRAASNRLADTRPLMPAFLALLSRSSRGQ